MTAHRVHIPQLLIPVFEGRADVRWARGGRGSAKTRSFATMLATVGMTFGLSGIEGQLLCCRQFMNSLEDSSLEECKRAIQDDPILSEYYELGEKYIKSKDKRVWFAFAGLDRNIASIKSKGRILVCWIDEGEPVTDDAFEVLIPTLREEGDGWNAELWVTWNPKRINAAVETRFARSTDPLVKGTTINWSDNPKFPEKLERDRQRDLAENPEQYAHIWEGDYQNVGDDLLIQPKLVRECSERHLVKERLTVGRRVIGIDPAHLGKDSTAVIHRKGDVLYKLTRFNQLKSMQLATQLKKIIDQATLEDGTAPVVNIDYAHGTGAAERLEELGYKVNIINFASKPYDTEKYRNRRAEMYGLMAEAMEEGNDYRIPPDAALITQLSYIKIDHDTSGKLILADKDVMKKHLGRSPDEADAAALTYAVPVRPLVAGSNMTSMPSFWS